jgi:hypothetical protein
MEAVTVKKTVNQAANSHTQFTLFKYKQESISNVSLNLKKKKN